MRHSVKSMLRDRKPKWQIQTAQEQIVSEVSDFLESLTRNNQ